MLRREVRAIALMMEAVSISETSANFFETTRRNTPEDSDLQIRRHENVKYQLVWVYFLSPF
jgi:hypothetical protein